MGLNSKDSYSSYRQIMKATSIFGGVQFINIIILIIRSKVIAILLGPLGMGILSLLNSTIGFIGSLTNFGLKTSAVKDIAASNNTKNKDEIVKTVSVIRNLVWITGFAGSFIILIFSKSLSELAFNNTDYQIAFMWLSITLLFQQLSNGQLIILQGLRKLKLLAKANTLGSFLGLIFTLPLYYIFGIKGIVPAMILTALITLILSWYFSKKIKIENINLSLKETFSNGKSMIKMGFMISLSGLLTVGIAYILRIYISQIGGIQQVGLYSAGFAIINSYVGLLFQGLATDYYPRLSSVATNNKLCNKVINQQTEIALLILGPIVVFFLIFINWIIILLYSYDFIPVNDMLYWAALGMFFKLGSWTIAFLFLAKGNGKLFFWNELFFHIYMLGLNILGYKIHGLTGLGLSFMVGYLLYLIQVYVITNIKFQFFYTINFFKIFIIQFSFAICAFFTVRFLNYSYFDSNILMYLMGIILILISILHSLREMDKRLDLKFLLRNFKTKLNDKK